jgi:hypothetical protein
MPGLGGQPNANCSLLGGIKRMDNFNQHQQKHCKYWFLRTLRVDHQSAHSTLTSPPREKSEDHHGLALEPEMISRFHDHEEGAV